MVVPLVHQGHRYVPTRAMPTTARSQDEHYDGEYEWEGQMPAVEAPSAADTAWSDSAPERWQHRLATAEVRVMEAMSELASVRTRVARARTTLPAWE